MKVMNEIQAEWDGVVEQILAGSEDIVEYGQPLFRVRRIG
jgi:acetyl-CoA carboxylase biotin carboxyl carrier protein